MPIFCFEGDGEFQAETLPRSVAHHEPVAAPVPKETYWGPEKYYFWNHPLQLMVCGTIMMMALMRSPTNQ